MFIFEAPLMRFTVYFLSTFCMVCMHSAPGEEMKSGKNEESGLLNKPPVEPVSGQRSKSITF